MKVTTKGQVTIPQEIRDRFGFLPHTDVDFEVRDGDVFLLKAGAGRRGRTVVEHLRGRGDVGMTADEILELTRSDRA